MIGMNIFCSRNKVLLTLRVSGSIMIQGCPQFFKHNLLIFTGQLIDFTHHHADTYFSPSYKGFQMNTGTHKHNELTIQSIHQTSMTRNYGVKIIFA